MSEKDHSAYWVSADKLSSHRIMQLIQVPGDGKFYAVNRLDIPSGENQLDIEVDMLVRGRLPAPFEVQLMMMRADSWDARLFWRTFKNVNFEPESGWLKRTDKMQEKITVRDASEYILAAKIDSPAMCEFNLDIVKFNVTHSDPIKP